jgi:hypothetical protein
MTLNVRESVRQIAHGSRNSFLRAKTIDTYRRGDTIRAMNAKKIEGRKTWLTGRR